MFTMRPTPRISTPTHARHAGRGGFALIITVVLLSFLVLLLVSLASLTRVETQVAANSTDLAKARQNALFALNIALGRLQKTAGPDQRVTATAEIVTGVAASKSKWTGVWDTTTPATAPGWLVSGAAPDVTADDLPALGANQATATHVRLVGSEAVNTAVAGNEIVVPLEELRSSTVPGLGGTDTLIGRFGYWVGDEGVKARANLNDPFAGSADVDDRIDRLSVPPRTSVAWLDTEFASVLDLNESNPPQLTARNEQIGRWIAYDQVAMLASTATAANNLKTVSRDHFHDVTVNSYAVNADVAKGGLKWDLSTGFELADATFDTTQFAAGSPTSIPAIGLPGKRVEFIYNEQLDSDRLLRGPTWDLLRRHYLLYRELNPRNPAVAIKARATYPNRPEPGLGDQTTLPLILAGGAVSKDPSTHDQFTISGSALTDVVRPVRPQIAPYLNNVALAFGIRTEELLPDHPGIFRVMMVMAPFVVLHNPYDVPVQLVDRNNDGVAGEIGISSLNLRLKIQIGANTYMASSTTRGTPFQLFHENQGGNNNSRTSLQMSLPPTTLQPGEVRVFSADGFQPIGGPDLKMKSGVDYNGGAYFSEINGVNKAEFFGPAYIIPPAACPTNGSGGTAGGPQPPSGAATVSTANHTELWTDNAGPISMTINADNWGAFGYEVTYLLESVSSGSGFSDVQKHKYKTFGYADNGTSAKNLRDYYGYTTSGGASLKDLAGGGQTASAYQAGNPPVYFLALQMRAKAADHPVDRATVPFVTSNPVAPAQSYESVGTNGLGFPGPPAMQLEYIDLKNGSVPLSDFLRKAPGGDDTYWGPSATNLAASGATSLSQVVLIDVPSRPMTSLGEFQHLGMSWFGYQPYFSFGNSFASPYIPANATTFDAGTPSKSWTLYDASYYQNKALWDGSFFSTLAPRADASGAWGAGTGNDLPAILRNWARGTGRLPNSRLVVYDKDSTAIENDLLPGGVLSATAYRKVAAHTLTKGAFNVNSVSPAAWLSVLGAARGQELVTNESGSTVPVAASNGVAIPRRLPNARQRDGVPESDASWNGVATLSEQQLVHLADSLAAEIKGRLQALGHPFFSLADFVNRSPTLSAARAQKGSLQTALDSAPLTAEGANSDWTRTNGSYVPVTPANAQADSRWAFRAPTNGVTVVGATASSYLLQSDVLQQIGAALTCRSDTFRLRTYGETLNPVSGKVDGRAWCEAVVQRLPDFVDAKDPALKAADPALTASTLSPADQILGNATGLAALNTTNRQFGRRFVIVSFRWLSPSDL
jgi:Tfp pilus assembly protein PilX